MTENQHLVDYGRLVTGTTLIGLGLLFWLDELGRFDLDEVWELWPLALIALGLGKMLGRDARRRSGGVIIASLGVLFLLDYSLDILSFQQSWPLLLLVIGASMVGGALAEGRSSTAEGRK